MNGDAEVQASQAVSLLTLQVQLGKIEGILQTIVAEHARRLSDLDENAKQLRNDLTAVKENAAREIASLRDNAQAKWDDANKAGLVELKRINEAITNLENGRRENREDIQEIRNRQAQNWPRVLSVLSLIIACGMFVIALLGRLL